MPEIYVIAQYLRVSLEDASVRAGCQDESHTIANQRSLLNYFINSKPEFRDSQILEYCDDGYTGVNFERPGVKALLADIKSKKIDCLVVKDFSRFGRDYLQVSDYVDQIFPFLGVRVISVNDGYDSADYDGKTSSVDIAFRNVVYAYYSKDISQKVRSGLRAKAQRGEFISPFAPFGYSKDKNNKNHLVAESRSAEVVRRIFELAGNGMGTQQIAYLLNSEGVPPPSIFKNEEGLHHKWWLGLGEDKEKFWSHNTIAFILRDERYLGKTVFGKKYRPEVGNPKVRNKDRETWVTVPDRHEPLVTRDVFQAAQKAIRGMDHGKGKQSGRHLFAGKLRCGVCGYALSKAGGGKMRYRCMTKSRTALFDCMPGAICADELTEAVWLAILQYCRVWLDSQETAAGMAAKGGLADPVITLQKQIAALQSALKRNDEQKAALYETMLDGGCDRAGYAKKRGGLSEKGERLEQEICGLEKKLVSLRQKSINAPLSKDIRNCLRSECLTAEILNSFVDCIYVHSDKSIEIRWLFDEGGRE